MWLSLRLATRNLFRNRRRSLLTLMAVLIPVILLDVSWGFTGGFEQSLFQDTVRLQTGHIQIREADYRKVGQTISLMRDIRPVITALEEHDQVEWHTIRLELPALVASGSRSKGVLVQGVEPVKAQEISLIQNWITEGIYLAENPENVSTPGVVGQSLVTELDLELNDEFIIISSHPETGTGVLRPTMTGVLQAPMRELNRGFVQIDLEDARRLVKSEQAATSVIVMVKGVYSFDDAPQISAVAEDLQVTLGEEFTVETWDELAPEITGYLQIARPILLAFMAIFFLLAGLVVLNTIYLNLLERSREMGIIMALGAGRGKIVSIVIMEAIVLAALGAAVGSAVGVGLVMWGSDGIALPQTYHDIYRQIGVNPQIEMAMSASEALISALLMLGIAILAAWLPARQTAKEEPIKVMKGI